MDTEDEVEFVRPSLDNVTLVTPSSHLPGNWGDKYLYAAPWAVNNLLEKKKNNPKETEIVIDCFNDCLEAWFTPMLLENDHVMGRLAKMEEVPLFEIKRADSVILDTDTTRFIEDSLKNIISDVLWPIFDNLLLIVDKSVGHSFISYNNQLHHRVETSRLKNLDIMNQIDDHLSAHVYRSLKMLLKLDMRCSRFPFFLLYSKLQDHAFSMGHSYDKKKDVYVSSREDINTGTSHENDNFWKWISESLGYDSSVNMDELLDTRQNERVDDNREQGSLSIRHLPALVLGYLQNEKKSKDPRSVLGVHCGILCRMCSGGSIIDEQGTLKSQYIELSTAPSVTKDEIVSSSHLSATYKELSEKINNANSKTIWSSLAGKALVFDYKAEKEGIIIRQSQHNIAEMYFRSIQRQISSMDLMYASSVHRYSVMMSIIQDIDNGLYLEFIPKGKSHVSYFVWNDVVSETTSVMELGRYLNHHELLLAKELNVTMSALTPSEKTFGYAWFSGGNYEHPTTINVLDSIMRTIRRCITNMGLKLKTAPWVNTAKGNFEIPVMEHIAEEYSDFKEFMKDKLSSESNEDPYPLLAVFPPVDFSNQSISGTELEFISYIIDNFAFEPSETEALMCSGVANCMKVVEERTNLINDDSTTRFMDICKTIIGQNYSEIRLLASIALKVIEKYKYLINTRYLDSILPRLEVFEKMTDSSKRREWMDSDTARTENDELAALIGVFKDKSLHETIYVNNIQSTFKNMIVNHEKYGMASESEAVSLIRKHMQPENEREKRKLHEPIFSVCKNLPYRILKRVLSGTDPLHTFKFKNIWKGAPFAQAKTNDAKRRMYMRSVHVLCSIMAREAPSIKETFYSEMFDALSSTEELRRAFLGDEIGLTTISSDDKVRITKERLSWLSRSTLRTRAQEYAMTYIEDRAEITKSYKSELRNYFKIYFHTKFFDYLFYTGNEDEKTDDKAFWFYQLFFVDYMEDADAYTKDVQRDVFSYQNSTYTPILTMCSRLEYTPNKFTRAWDVVRKSDTDRILSSLMRELLKDNELFDDGMIKEHFEYYYDSEIRTNTGGIDKVMTHCINLLHSCMHRLPTLMGHSNITWNSGMFDSKKDYTFGTLEQGALWIHRELTLISTILIDRISRYDAGLSHGLEAKWDRLDYISLENKSISLDSVRDDVGNIMSTYTNNSSAIEVFASYLLGETTDDLYPAKFHLISRCISLISELLNLLKTQQGEVTSSHILSTLFFTTFYHAMYGMSLLDSLYTYNSSDEQFSLLSSIKKVTDNGKGYIVPELIRKLYEIRPMISDTAVMLNFRHRLKDSMDANSNPKLYELVTSIFNGGMKSIKSSLFYCAWSSVPGENLKRLLSNSFIDETNENLKSIIVPVRHDSLVGSFIKSSGKRDNLDAYRKSVSVMISGYSTIKDLQLAGTLTHDGADGQVLEEPFIMEMRHFMRENRTIFDSLVENWALLVREDEARLLTRNSNIVITDSPKSFPGVKILLSSYHEYANTLKHTNSYTKMLTDNVTCPISATVPLVSISENYEDNSRRIESILERVHSREWLGDGSSELTVVEKRNSAIGHIISSMTSTSTIAISYAASLAIHQYMSFLLPELIEKIYEDNILIVLWKMVMLFNGITGLNVTELMEMNSGTEHSKHLEKTAISILERHGGNTESTKRAICNLIAQSESTLFGFAMFGEYSSRVYGKTPLPVERVAKTVTDNVVRVSSRINSDKRQNSWLDWFMVNPNQDKSFIGNEEDKLPLM